MKLYNIRFGEDFFKFKMTFELDLDLVKLDLDLVKVDLDLVKLDLDKLTLIKVI